MNNIEKNLNEIYEKFYYPIYINELMEYLDEKYTSIISRGKSQGETLTEEDEKQLFHNLYKEGVNYFLFTKLVKKIKEYEESISSQPLLLANPSNIENKEYLNFISSFYIKKFMDENYCLIDSSLYEDM